MQSARNFYGYSTNYVMGSSAARKQLILRSPGDEAIFDKKGLSFTWKWVVVFSLLLVGTGCSYLPLGDLTLQGVKVTDHRDYIEMTPVQGLIHPVGLMFWPGGLVDPQAYRPSLGVFAARGYRVVIAKVPANLAIVSLNKGLDLADRLGGSWVAAGHSLGGTAAAWTIFDHPSAFKALVLMAAYPADSTSLATWNGPVLSLAAENDGLATQSTLLEKRPLLPPEGVGSGQTRFRVINGGNHAQFGSYGAQDKDGTATISPQQQWELMADELKSFWDGLP